MSVTTRITVWNTKLNKPSDSLQYIWVIIFLVEPQPLVNYFIISRLENESPAFQLAMFKHSVGDEGLKVIKTFGYNEHENSSDWKVVMAKVEAHCIGEVNETFVRYVFNNWDKLQGESIDSYVAELNTLVKTCNVCNCLPDSLIRDGVVLGIKNEQTTKKLLRTSSALCFVRKRKW